MSIISSIAVGLHNLTEGTKNPLSEYNKGFKHLQTRRCMQPLTDFVPRLTTPSQTAEPIPGTNTPARSPNNSTASSQEPSLQVNNINFQPSDEEEEDLEGTDSTETKMILDDLMDGVQEPTLPRLSEEDIQVEVDMDKVFMEVDNDVEQAGCQYSRLP